MAIYFLQMIQIIQRGLPHDGGVVQFFMPAGEEEELEEEEDDANHVISYPDTDVGDEGDTGEVGDGDIRGSYKDNDKIKMIMR